MNTISVNGKSPQQNQDTKKMTDKEKLNVEIKVVNGLRYGTLNFGEYSEDFPKQIITSTNEGHVTNFEDEVDLETKPLQIFLNLKVNEITKDENTKSIRGKKARAKRLISIPKRIGWIFINSFFGTSKITKKSINKALELQEGLGCKIKSLYIPKNLKPKLATELINENLNSIVYIDMGDTPTHFREIYKKCIDAGINLICFIIRMPSKRNLENYNFIAKRVDDNVIRIAAQLPKRSSIVNDRSLSFFYYFLGFDGFAYRGGSKPYDTTIEKLSIYRKGAYRFDPISEFKECKCKSHKGETPYNKASEYHDLKKASIPSSIHDHIEINRDFSKLRNKLISKEIDVTSLKEAIEFESTMNSFLERETSKK